MTADDTDQSMVDGLVQLSFAVQTVLATAAGRHDLTVAQVRLMGILRDRTPGMRELAGHLGLDKSSATGLVDRAQKRGLVTRKASTEDGRSVHVASTPLGRRLTKKVEAEITAEIGVLTAALSATERTSLSRIARRVLGDQPG
jgi:DNA-binding MarR family transcriptional regulator